MSTVIEPSRNRGGKNHHHHPISDIAHGSDTETLDPLDAEIWNRPGLEDASPLNESDRLHRPAAEDADGFSSLVDQKAAKKRDMARPTKEERVRKDNLSYWAIGWLAMAHLACLAAPFYFTWQAVVTALVLHWLAGSLGICLGYHRMLTHTGMKTYNWVRYLFAGIGCFAGEGSPLDWVADHRKHHAHSDQKGDPHSPHDGGLWSHMTWLAFHTHNGDRKAYLERWAPDLYRDPVMRAFDMLFLPIHIVAGLALFGAGYYFGGLYMATSMLLWGMFVRLVFVLHATWMVNSASHMFGYKNYETTDDSRNNWLVAIVAYGEGWHNNHHAYPRMAKHGHKWWEFDITWQSVRLLRAVGLIWDVVDYRTAAEKRAAAVVVKKSS